MYQTTDNNVNNHLMLNEADHKDDIASLEKIAGKSIATLCKEHPSLLVFPLGNGKSGDRKTHGKIEDEPIFTLKRTKGDEVNHQYELETRNLMGFVGIGETQLLITSRFSDCDGEKPDYFLHYMLEKVLRLNIFRLETHSNSDSVLNLLVFMFPVLLKRAMRQGIYKEYQGRQHNDANVRGAIDVSRHIKTNMPFAGRIAYNTREYSFDNKMTQLIRHTIECIRTCEYSGLLMQEGVRPYVEQIMEATSTYSVRNRARVISENQKFVPQAFFADYMPLQNLCLMILQRKTQSFGKSKKKVYGLLFDGAWLWEEYLGKILDTQGFKHSDNKAGKGGIYLFKKREKATTEENEQEEDSLIETAHRSRCRRYPDFYLLAEPRKGQDAIMVLDAKYKHLEKSVPREDLYQIISYMHVMNCNVGGFIYPSQVEVANPDPLGELCGMGGAVNLYGLHIPSGAASYAEFLQNMRQREAAFVIR